MEYFLIKPDGETTGTFSIEQIRDMLSSGFIGHDTRYWHEGITGWQPIDRIEESLSFNAPAESAAKKVAPQKIAAVLKAVPPPSTKLEKKTQEVPSPYEPYIPQPTHIEHEPIDEESPVEVAITTPVPVVGQAQTGIPRLADRIFCLAAGALIVLAVDHGASAVSYLSDALASKVTLSGDSTFVLLDPATIKVYEKDLQSSPTIETLKNQISQAVDQPAIERLTIGIETERSRHGNEVRQQYLQSNNAEYVDAATYRILGYFDSNGEPTSPRAGQPVWVAISYKEHTVYALKLPESANATQ